MRNATIDQKLDILTKQDYSKHLSTDAITSILETFWDYPDDIAGFIEYHRAICQDANEYSYSELTELVYMEYIESDYPDIDQFIESEWIPDRDAYGICHWLENGKLFVIWFSG